MNFSHTGFIRGYKVALLWANTYVEVDGESVNISEVDVFPTIWDFTPEAEAEISQECNDFLSQDGVIGLIESVLSDSYDSEYAGHDFLLTRSGHGAGFWDRGFGEAGDKLSDLSRPFGDAAAWVDADEAVHYGW